ncbi:ABC transporter permease [Georgenia daeguensis]|uniref:ABC transporter permease n=1 Tax=Georgenia daeguensis TaxID=908355 RepID=A0ABP8EV78_9MICO
MTYFVLKRLRHGLLSLFGIVILVFLLARATGSPARLYLPEDAGPEAIAAFNAEHGLDQPLYIQLFDYLKGLVRLDLGESMAYGEPALATVLSRYPATLQLSLVTIVIAAVLGIFVGAASAARRRSVFDGGSRVMSLAALSVPDFWIGITGIAVFSVWLGLLPTSGNAGWQYWILPVMTLAMRPAGILTQVTRSSMLGALDSDYVKVARGKGVRPAGIVYKHALRNAAIPIITVAGLSLAQVVNGALVVETVFGWPGVGTLMVTSIYARDFAVIQAVVLVTGAAIIALNFLIDVAYSWVNPQIRFGD